MKNIKDLMKMQKHLQEGMQKMQEELALKTVEASSGGGMVTATVSGQQELMKIKINKEAVDPNDVEMLEDLIIAAVNSGIEKSKEMSQNEMSKLTSGINIPGLPF